MSTSIYGAISDRLASGEIKPYVSLSCHKPRRAIYLTKKAEAEIRNSALQILAGTPAILGALDAWTLGQWIPGNKKRGEFLVPLDPPPDDVWEIKIRAPCVQGRLFIRFIDADVLLGTHTHTRGHLDSGFQEAMKECVDTWEELFPGALPFRGSSIHDYITFNCDDFPHIARKPKRR